jgi:cytoskeletal protein CcmA (bactofilin family)
MAEEKGTVIDPQADVEGKLKGKDALILGRFRGQIEVSGRVVLGEGSRVDATVVADAAEVAGELKGDVRARAVTLAEKARVQGTVDARVLVVREGAWLSGSVSAGEAAGKGAAPLASPLAAHGAAPSAGASPVAGGSPSGDKPPSGDKGTGGV